MNNNRGFTIIESLLIFIIAAIVGGTGYYVWNSRQQTNQDLNAAQNETSAVKVTKKASGNDATSSNSATGSTTVNTKGKITGSLGYPSEFIPAQKVCAVNISTKEETCTTTTDNQGTFELYVEPGDYNVYASLVKQQGDTTTTYKAYYDQYVVCGNSYQCAASDHTDYVKVTVTAGQTADKVTPTDWYNTQ